jgi:hypothetical protein
MQLVFLKLKVTDTEPPLYSKNVLIYTVHTQNQNNKKSKVNQIYMKDNTFASLCPSTILYVQTSNIIIKIS